MATSPRAAGQPTSHMKQVWTGFQRGGVGAVMGARSLAAVASPAGPTGSTRGMWRVLYQWTKRSQFGQRDNRHLLGTGGRALAVYYPIRPPGANLAQIRPLRPLAAGGVQSVKILGPPSPGESVMRRPASRWPLPVLGGLTILLTTLTAAAKPADGPQKVATVEGVTEYRLANGARVLLFPDPS